MIPFVIITASSFEAQIKQAKKFIKSIIKDKELLKALSKDFPFSHPDILILTSEKPSLGIDLIRELKKILARKPYQASQRLVLVPQAEKLTLEAQNALLKTLEEPPKDTIIILTTLKKDFLLPTILSRGQVISHKTALKLEKKKKDEYLQLIKKVLAASPGKKILLAENFSQSREEAMTFCQELLLFWHQLLLSPRQAQQIKLTLLQISQALKQTQKAKNLLEKNINVKLVIEEMFLCLPKSPK